LIGPFDDNGSIVKSLLLKCFTNYYQVLTTTLKILLYFTNCICSEGTSIIWLWPVIIKSKIRPENESQEQINAKDVSGSVTGQHYHLGTQ